MCVCLYIDYKFSVTPRVFLQHLHFFCRLLKSRLEKEEFESKLRDLQGSLLKKETPASDSSAEVIYISRQAEHRLCSLCG